MECSRGTNVSCELHAPYPSTHTIGLEVHSFTPSPTHAYTHFYVEERDQLIHANRFTLALTTNPKLTEWISFANMFIGERKNIPKRKACAYKRICLSVWPRCSRVELRKTTAHEWCVSTCACVRDKEGKRERKACERTTPHNYQNEPASCRCETAAKVYRLRAAVDRQINWWI